MTTSRGRTILALLGGLAVALIVLELALGAVSFGQPDLANPCTAKAVSTGSGISALVERFARATLNGAACKLHTTREGLVMSFVPGAGTNGIRWDLPAIDSAQKAELEHAVRS